MQKILFQTLLIAAMLSPNMVLATGQSQHEQLPCCCGTTVDACLILCELAKETLGFCFIKNDFPTCICIKKDGDSVSRTITATSGGCTNNGKNFCPTSLSQ